MSKYNIDSYDTASRYMNQNIDYLEYDDEDEDNYDDDKLEFVLSELRKYCHENYLPFFDNHQTVEKFKNALHINFSV